MERDIVELTRVMRDTIHSGYCRCVLGLLEYFVALVVGYCV